MSSIKTYREFFFTFFFFENLPARQLDGRQERTKIQGFINLAYPPAVPAWPAGKSAAIPLTSEVAAYGSGLLLNHPFADFLNGQLYKAGPSDS